MKEKAGILVVGAGVAGAVYARTLAEAGYRVQVIDQRPHVAGNAFDETDPQTGIRFHRYGPHLFHTKLETVVQWLSRFTTWLPYEHRVRALMEDGRYVPLPVNMETINSIFTTALNNQAEVEAFLQELAVPHVAPRNALDYLQSKIGVELTELLFARYTRKMWALGLEDMDASVVKRLPIRFNHDNRYFPEDRFQMLPEQGYTALVQAILDHSGITVDLSTPFERAMQKDVFWTFNSMAIDEYFDSALGPLPYRSIRFHHVHQPIKSKTTWAVTNFTDTGPITRETHWHLLPGHDNPAGAAALVTREEPCDYRDNHMERYYPVKTADGVYVDRYGQYRQMARQEPALTFIGRCGTYQYLDMDQVINQSLAGARKWLDEQAR